VPDLARILLPVDFSERSAGAARYAKSLARHFLSELTLLHVLTPPQYEFGALDIGGSMIAELYQDRSAMAAKELDAFLETYLADVNVRRVVIEGDPAGKIVEYAHDRGVGLIVIPTHGYGPFRRFILGSNTAKVLHDADCPVWTGVHLEDAPSGGISIRRVVCAVDLGAHTLKTIEWAAWFSCTYGARLTLVHVATPHPDADDSVRRAALADLERMRREAGIVADVAAEAGDTAPVICGYAASQQADLLVIGRGSAAGVFGRLRTNAYAIIRQSPCPVVSV
jgi:nucleotide-binding universal stress UspA family protein